jgi:hypothetical protein
MVERAANIPPFFPEMQIIGHKPLVAAMVKQPTATPQRLALAHQRVELWNTDQLQTHYVKDRFEQYHTLLPGKRAELDMVVSEIKNLHDLSRTDRGFYLDGPKKGQAFEPHPVKVCGIPPVQSRPDDREAELAAKAASLAAREAELVERELRLNAAAGVK